MRFSEVKAAPPANQIAMYSFVLNQLGTMSHMNLPTYLRLSRPIRAAFRYGKMGGHADLP